MIIYQFSNSTQIFFIILFSILLLFAIASLFFMIPLFKLVFQSFNPIKARIVLMLFNIVICSFLLTIIVLSTKNIIQYYSLTVGLNINDCDITSGEIQTLIKEPQYSRGADLTFYYLSCEIDGREYYIDMGNGVSLENIDFWNEGNNITVYYKNIEEKNIIIRAIKN